MSFARSLYGWSLPPTPPSQLHRNPHPATSPFKHSQDRLGFKRRKLTQEGHYVGSVPEQRGPIFAYGASGFTAKGLKRESYQSLHNYLKHRADPAVAVGPIGRLSSDQWLKAQLRYYDISYACSDSNKTLRRLLREAVGAGMCHQRPSRIEEIKRELKSRWLASNRANRNARLALFDELNDCGLCQTVRSYNRAWRNCSDCLREEFENDSELFFEKYLTDETGQLTTTKSTPPLELDRPPYRMCEEVKRDFKFRAPGLIMEYSINEPGFGVGGLLIIGWEQEDVDEIIAREADKAAKAHEEAKARRRLVEGSDYFSSEDEEEEEDEGEEDGDDDEDAVDEDEEEEKINEKTSR